MSLCSVGPRFGGAAVRIGACRKSEAVSPKANPPRATPKRCVPKSGSSEPEGQPAERQLRNGRRKNELAQQPLRIGACRKAEAMSPKTNRRAEESTRRGQFPKQKPEGQLAQRQLRSGACRKSEAVSPKANPPRATPKRCVPKSGSSEPEGQPAERQLRNGRRKNELAQRPLRSGAGRKAEAVSPKANPPRATPKRKAEEPIRRAAISEAEGNAERRKPPEPRAVKPAGRSRETRGRRSSADTPTNTIEKRDCDTLRPSEAS